MFDITLNALDRDITGDCKGECRDRVREGEDERQLVINMEKVDTPEYYPEANWARPRTAQPGIFGGHV
jgi:hypothetical protein